MGLFAAWNLNEQGGNSITDEVSGWTGTSPRPLVGTEARLMSPYWI